MREKMSQIGDPVWNRVCALSLLLTASLLPRQVAPKAGDITDSPEGYVLAHASPNDGIVEFDCRRCSAMTDLVFVASDAECGNAGCSFYVFQKAAGKSYAYITKVFLDHGGFQFLRTKHHGRNDILFYHHMSATEGELVRYEFDGKDYQEVGDSETISSDDFLSRISPEPVKQVYLSKELKPIQR